MSADDLLRNTQRDQAAILRAFNGAAFSRVEYLGILIDESTPTVANRTHHIEIERKPVNDGVIFNDDRHVGHVGVGTHIDGVGHIEQGGVYHGGYTTAQVFHERGLRELGIAESEAVIGGPFKLLDMAAYLGARVVAPGYEYSVDDVRGAMQEQRVAVEHGDIVALRSGWVRYLQDAKTFNGAAPGLGLAAATFLADMRPRMIAGDTGALEVLKSSTAGDFPVHKLLLRDRGILIGEVFNLEKLARDQVRKGSIIISVAQIKGCAQAKVNPVVLV